MRSEAVTVENCIGEAGSEWSSDVLSGYELTGLARGGEQLSRLKRNYAKAVELLVELASLQVGGAADRGLCSASDEGVIERTDSV